MGRRRSTSTSGERNCGCGWCVYWDVWSCFSDSIFTCTMFSLTMTFSYRGAKVTKTLWRVVTCLQTCQKPFNLWFRFWVLCFIFEYLQYLPVPVLAVLYKIRVYCCLREQICIIMPLSTCYLKTTTLSLIAIVTGTIYRPGQFVTVFGCNVKDVEKV